MRTQQRGIVAEMVSATSNETVEEEEKKKVEAGFPDDDCHVVNAVDCKRSRIAGRHRHHVLRTMAISTRDVS
jgi:hypothetical protein